MALFTDNILRVATYNVCDEKDYDSMATEFLNNGMDVVALQGIEKLVYDKILRSMKSRGYSNYANPSSPFRKTFEVIFSRLPSKKEYKLFSNTNQSCGIIKYIFDIPVRSPSMDGGATTSIITIAILTSHLEENGTGNGNRLAQLKEIDTLTKDDKCAVIFAGDTSIPSWQSVTLPNGWYDAWREKGTIDTEITKTYDSVIGVVQDRPDRVLYRLSQEQNLECIDFMLGCKAGYRHAPIAIFRLL
jgi:hypothetical protein